MKRAICIILCLAAFCTLLSAGDGLYLNTVVIDPGHGGKDPGAVSKDRKTYEKTIVLDISRRLADKIRSEYPEVDVVMTRDKDVFIPLAERANIANKAGANLFISIHVNSTRSTTPSGFSLHVMGQSAKKGTDLYEMNMESVMRENSVIKLEDDYSASYEGFDPEDPESYIFMQLMQNAYLEQSLAFAQTVKKHLRGGPVKNDKGIWQNPFYVLWRTSMPSVLVELGFISNATDLEALRKSENREAMASRLFDAFKEYKSTYDRSLNSSDSLPVEFSSGPSKKADAPVQQASGDVRYGVQIFSGSAKIEKTSSRFLGYEPLVVDAGSVKKYVISVADNPSVPFGNLSAIRKKYPDAFVVEINGNKVAPYKKH